MISLDKKMLNDVYLDSKTRNCDIAKDVIKPVIMAM